MELCVRLICFFLFSSFSALSLLRHSIPFSRHIGPGCWRRKHEHDCWSHRHRLPVDAARSLNYNVIESTVIPLDMNTRPMQWRSKNTEDERIGMKSLFFFGLYKPVA